MVLTTLGMPEDKAAIYEIRLKTGEFQVMAEVPADKSGEYQLLMESAGGEEVHVSEQILPRACAGRCNSPDDLSPEVRSHLSENARESFIDRYNFVLGETEDQLKAEQAAWEKIYQEFEEDENGVWSKQKVST
ncbi:MAG: ChaB family protein [Microcoleaceae cyanobacterium]